jgi:hypothetical protein
MRRLFRPLRFIVGLTLALAGPPGQALIFFGHDAPEHNTSAPVGVWADSGWQYQVFFDFTATIVGPEHVLTAAHLHLAPNSLARFDGLVYRTLSSTNLPGTDLSLLRVAGRFARWAPLFQGTHEAGQVATLFGRGLPRGEPVRLDANGVLELRGWRWGANDARPRWGTNVVEDVLPPGVAHSGAVLACLFDADAGTDEATVTGGDSGGGLFLRAPDGSWQLAGVALAVQAQFNTETTGDGFWAALFDRRGFYEPDLQSQWVLDPTADRQPETALYHTRVSTYAATLTALMAEPAPATDSFPRLQSSDSLAGPFLEHAAYAVDSAAREVTAKLHDDHRFFRLQGAPLIRLLAVEGGQIRLGF